MGDPTDTEDIIRHLIQDINMEEDMEEEEEEEEEDMVVNISIRRSEGV